MRVPPSARLPPLPKKKLFRGPPLERVPGLYAALLSSTDAMDENDITGVRGPKQSCFVDIEKVPGVYGGGVLSLCMAVVV